MISWLIFAGIILLGMVMYYPVTAYGWITGPDLDNIFENKLIARFSINSITDIFLSVTEGTYQPLTILSLGIQTALAPANPSAVYHTVNLVLHLLCVILLFRIVKVLGRSESMAGIAALIFCVHPLNTEAVAWISSHGILLCSFFFMLGLLSYVYEIRADRGKGFLSRMTWISFILALLSHPMAVIFPLVLLLVDLINGTAGRKMTGRKIPMFILSAIFLIVAIAGMIGTGGDPQEPMPGIAGRVMFALGSPLIILAGFIAPFFQSACHPYPEVAGYQYLIVSLLVLLLIMMLRMAWNKNKNVFSVMMFLIMTMLAAALLSFDGPRLFSERHMYLASAGLSVMLAALVILVFRYYILKKRVLLILISILLTAYTAMLAYLSTERIALWEDSGKLWTDAIIKYPHHHQAYFLRGDFWAMKGDYEKAKFDYSQAIRMNERAYRAINNLGLIYMEERELRYAISEFGRAIEINPDFYKPYLNRGIAYMRIGMNERALEDMGRAAMLKPDEPLVYYNRGLIYERVTDLERAVGEFTEAIKLAPSVALFYKERGRVYVWMQQHRLAESDFSKAIDINPGDAEMWFRRSMARVTQDKLRAGLQDAIMAKQLGYPVDEEYIKGLTVQVLEADSVNIK